MIVYTSCWGTGVASIIKLNVFSPDLIILHFSDSSNEEGWVTSSVQVPDVIPNRDHFFITMTSCRQLPFVISSLYTWCHSWSVGGCPVQHSVYLKKNSLSMVLFIVFHSLIYIWTNDGIFHVKASYSWIFHICHSPGMSMQFCWTIEMWRCETLQLTCSCKCSLHWKWTSVTLNFTNCYRSIRLVYMVCWVICPTHDYCHKVQCGIANHVFLLPYGMKEYGRLNKCIKVTRH